MRISVDEILNSTNTGNEGFQNNQKRTSFFSLPNDNDSAIIRFLHKDVNDFEVLDIHTINLGGKDRKIACTRNEGDCPLCKNNEYLEDEGKFKYPLQRRIFIHLLKYTSPTECEEQVFERGKDFIPKLLQLVEDYGPLCDRLYKIVRHGQKGSTDTSYDILPLDKDRFIPANYKFDLNQLNYTPALGTFIMDRKPADVACFIETGNFPEFNNTNIVARPTNISQNVNTVMPEVSPITATEVTPMTNSSNEEKAPWEEDEPTQIRRRF